MSQFAELWKKDKAEFEAKTGKKKPAEKLAGFFRKGAGIGDALKDLDAAVAKKDTAKIVSAREKFIKAKDEYVGTIEKAIKESKEDSVYSHECSFLKARLGVLVEMAKNAEANSKIINLDELAGQEIRKWMASSFASDSKIIALTSHAALKIGDIYTKAPDEKLTKLQAHAKTKFTEAVKLKGQFKELAKQTMEGSKLIPLALAILDKFGRFIQGDPDSLLVALTEMHSRMTEIFREVRKVHVEFTNDMHPAMAVFAGFGPIIENELVLSGHAEKPLLNRK